MNTPPAGALRLRASRPLTSRPLTGRAFVVALLLAAGVPASAQKTAADAARHKLPSADKIVGDYLKAAGC